MSLTIKTTRGYSKENGVKVMVYGEPNKGKTYLITTLPKPIVIAAESGLATIAKHDIPYFQCVKKATVFEVIAWLKDPKNYIGKYESIVLDSVSYLTHAILAEIRDDPKAPKDGRKQYGMMQEIVLSLLQALFEVQGLHVYVTAWQGEKTNPMGVVEGIMPITAGQAIRSYLLHFFDQTLHLAWHLVDAPQADGTLQKVRIPYLQTCEANGIFARDRTQKLDAFEPADLGALFTKLAQASGA